MKSLNPIPFGRPILDASYKGHIFFCAPPPRLGMGSGTQSMTSDTQSTSSDTQSISSDTQNISSDTQSISSDTQSTAIKFRHPKY